MTTNRFFFAFMAILLLSGCAEIGRTTTEAARETVLQAQHTVERLKASNDLDRFAFRRELAAARGVVVLPAVVKAGFIGAAEGGNGVLLARGGDGTWSDPAFYTLASGSFGLQIGVQGVEMLMILRNDKAVRAILENQGKFGADAGATIGVIGVGVEGSTTTNLGADILVYTYSFVGAYGGISLEGAVLARRNDLNAGYYGEGATPQAIVFDRAFSNPQAAGLKAALAGG